MTKNHPTPYPFKQYDLSKKLLISTIAGVVAGMSDSALASCDSERNTCKSSCQSGYAELTTACAEECTRKYDDCASIWAQILMTREERDTCRRLAYSESEHCIAEAEKYRDWCKEACDDNWQACNS
jgi:hypothetical protein